jgi:hypothetical protein
MVLSLKSLLVMSVSRLALQSTAIMFLGQDRLKIIRMLPFSVLLTRQLRILPQNQLFVQQPTLLLTLT